MNLRLQPVAALFLGAFLLAGWRDAGFAQAPPVLTSREPVGTSRPQSEIEPLPVSVWPAPRKTVFKGPLRVSKTNPRYFTDDSGKAIYLTGSHTWANFPDSRSPGHDKPFDYPGYLRFLAAHNHNFIRLWRWELPAWDEDDGTHRAAWQPWRRVGPGLARDGGLQFDLTQFDPAYFSRLRQRVIAARQAGMYVSIMLFEGWAMQFIKGAWQAHPFYPDNHLGALAGPPPDANGVEIYELKYPAVTALQEAYVRKVIATVNDLDNALYEVSNENHAASTAWQIHFIRFIKAQEAARPKQHPVGMTFQYAGGDNAALFDSPADWVGPGTYWPSDTLQPANLDPKENYRDDPLPADGRKVVLLDTDHLWGVGGSAGWVWKAFLRGHNVLCMDPIPTLTGFPEEKKADLESVRRAMGATRALSSQVDLARLTPQNALASTGYCLANPAQEYLVYQPDSGPFTVALAPGRYTAVWLDPFTGRARNQNAAQGGGMVTFTPPLPTGAVLHLQRTKETPDRKAHGH